MSHALEIRGDLEYTLREEITFWQLYIQHCQIQKRNLVLPRAEAALKQAEQKLSLYLSRLSNKDNAVPLRH